MPKSPLNIFNYTLCFAQEAELNHPELLALPDDIEVCEKAARYNNLYV